MKKRVLLVIAAALVAAAVLVGPPGASTDTAAPPDAELIIGFVNQGTTAPDIVALTVAFQPDTAIVGTSSSPTIAEKPQYTPKSTKANTFTARGPDPQDGTADIAWAINQVGLQAFGAVSAEGGDAAALNLAIEAIIAT